MRSVALADTIQGTLLLFGMLVSGAAVVFAFGGPRGYFEAISDLPPEALSLPGASGRYSPWLLMTICIFASLASMIRRSIHASSAPRKSAAMSNSACWMRA